MCRGGAASFVIICLSVHSLLYTAPFTACLGSFLRKKGKVAQSDFATAEKNSIPCYVQEAWGKQPEKNAYL